MPPNDDVVVLRPDLGLVSAWTVVGLCVLGGAVWILVDARGAFLAWLLVALCAVVVAFVASQLRTSWFHVRLEPERLIGVTPWGRREIAWHDIALARVIRVTGESVLELHVHADAASPHAGQAIGILLPIGADLAVLHRVLEARLGRLPTAA